MPQNIHSWCQKNTAPRSPSDSLHLCPRSAGPELLPADTSGGPSASPPTDRGRQLEGLGASAACKVGLPAAPLTFLGWLLVVAQLPAHVLQALLQFLLLFLSHLLLGLGRLLLPTRGCGEESGGAQAGGGPGSQSPGRARTGMAPRAASDGRLTRCGRGIRPRTEGGSGQRSRRPGLGCPLRRGRGREGDRRAQKGGACHKGRGASSSSQACTRRGSPSQKLLGLRSREEWHAFQGLSEAQPEQPAGNGSPLLPQELMGRATPSMKKYELQKPPAPHPAKGETPFPQDWPLPERNFPNIRAAAALLPPPPASETVVLPSSQAGPHPQPPPGTQGPLVCRERER